MFSKKECDMNHGSLLGENSTNCFVLLGELKINKTHEILKNVLSTSS